MSTAFAKCVDIPSTNFFFGPVSNAHTELAEVSPYNWLDDNFWLRRAYLENRLPLLVHSNWWLALQDDLTVPESIRLAPRPEPFNIWQLRRAAWTVKRMLTYKKLLDE